MNKGKWFLVCSPEYGEVIPILDDGSGPMEYGRDAVYVRARTRRRARVLAVRWFRRFDAKYLQRVDNPFRGMMVEDLSKYPDESSEGKQE